MTQSTFVDLVEFYTTTVGTGTLVVGPAVSGRLLPTQARGIASGDVVSYGLSDGAQSEVGQGTLTNTGGIWTLSRDVVSQSTNGGSLINCSGNSASVALTLRAEDLELVGNLSFTLNLLPSNAVNDAAAATAGVPVGGIYRNGSILMIRVT